jgi:hypothetical protein
MMQHGLLTEAKVLHANKIECPANCWLSRIVQLSQRNSAYLLSKRSKKIQGALLSDKLPGSRDKTTKWYDFETPYQTIIDYIASTIKIQFKIASLN